ncbi:hypothetical protein CBM2625_A200019 [Cupriavidus taiwanensis]|nr:hypothetical protein CBM2625_A200019 [Cupriavidus taiwanensis]
MLTSRSRCVGIPMGDTAAMLVLCDYRKVAANVRSPSDSMRYFDVPTICQMAP